MLTIYKTDASPPARAVMMIADILGIKYISHEINPVLRDQDTPEMIKKNPMRTVPYIDDDGFCLGDSHAIMIYLFEKYGKSEHLNLYPKDVKKKATVHQRLFFDTGILFPRLRSIMAPTYGGFLTELSKSMKKNTDDAYKMLEAYLSNSLFMADDVITLADISIITTISSLNGLYEINGTKYPKLQQWYKNMSEQDYCKKINEPGAEEHIAGLKALMEFNKTKRKSNL